MKKFSLNVTSRQVHGRGPAHRRRLEGAIPAIIYGKSGNQSVSVKHEDFRTLMRAKGTAAALIDLNVDGKVMLSLIKESQRHPITQKFLHIDIMEIDPNSLMTAAIPVRIIGDANNWVTGIECQKMELGEPDESGRRKPIAVPGSEYIIPVQTVIEAIGQRVEFVQLEKTIFNRNLGSLTRFFPLACLAT